MTTSAVVSFASRHKAFIRHWIPQGLRDWVNRASGRAIRYRGIYDRWEDAVGAARAGYSEQTLLERLEKAALAVQRGEAVWEQDGVVHDRVPTDFPLTSSMARVAIARGGKVRVLDFGGALGSSYHQCRALLPELAGLEWCIVEQPPLVQSGRKHFAAPHLRFEDDIESCLANGAHDVALLCGVLQYLPRPYELLDLLSRAPIEYLIIDRNACSLTTELITVQVLPSSLYSASYPSWLFDGQRLTAALSKSYELLAEWDGKDPPIYGRGIGAKFVGSFWRKRSAP